MNKIRCALFLLLGIIIGSASIILANQAIQALQNTELKVSFNGVIQNFKDESTSEAQYPITYNDRTYLPLRNIANLLGVYITYDNDNNTVLLSTGLDKILFSEYSKLVAENENNNLKNWFGNIRIEEYSEYDSSMGFNLTKYRIKADYLGDTKFDTDTVEKLIKEASEKGSKTFTITNETGYNIKVYTNEEEQHGFSRIPEFENVHLVCKEKNALYDDIRFIAKTDDGYYLYSSVDAGMTNYPIVQSITQKNALVVELEERIYDVMATLTIEDEFENNEEQKMSLYDLKNKMEGLDTLHTSLLKIKNGYLYIITDGACFDEYMDFRGLELE